MKLLNRSGLSVRPLAPFIAWCRQLTGEDAIDVDTLAALGEEATLYLIDEVESEADFQAALDAHGARIFENELEAWCMDPDLWPSDRGPQALLAWFAIEPQLMVFDLGEKPLLVAHYDESLG